MNTTEANLIGYLLGALDDEGRRRVEGWIRSDSTVTDQLDRLRQALEPLAFDRDTPDPPPGLVEATVDLVEGYRPPSLPFAPRPATPSGFWSWVRRADVLVAAVLVLVCSGLVAVWLMRTRQQSDVVACQNNLRQVHGALTAYSEQRPDRLFPQVPEAGPHAFAAVYVPALTDAGVLSPRVSIRCPANGPRGPSLEPGQLRRLEIDPEHQRRLAIDLSDVYAYSLGYRQGGHLYGLRVEPGNDSLPILADRPPLGPNEQGARNSPDHSGRGQNVLYIGGHVRFVSQRGVGVEGDDIYLNQDRRVSAGVHRRDTVLGSSSAAP
jgi:hypothetical protein